MENIPKIVIYGDSLMKGTVLDENMRYHTVMAENIRDFSKALGLSVKNRAKFGSTIVQGAGIMERDLSESLDYDYALIEFGGNDCSFKWKEVAQNPELDHRPITSLEQFEKTCLCMISKLKARNITPALMTLPPIDAERHLDFIGREGDDRRGILRWLGDANMIYRFHEHYSSSIEKIAQITQTILVDVRSRFLVRHDLKDLICLDGVHLKPEGYRMIADAFADFVRGLRLQRGARVAT